MSKKIWRYATLLLVLTFLLAACGGSKTAPPVDSQPQTSEPAAGGEPAGGQPAAEPAQTEGPRVGGILKLGSETDIKSPDASAVRSWQSHEVLRHVVEGLLTVDGSLAPTPLLAKSWSMSGDGREYTFELEQGVKFHNGKDFKAADVVYSINWAKAGTRASELDLVEKVEAAGDYTVKFTLTQPSGIFLTTLANPYTFAMYPEGLAEEQGGEVKTPVGTGPYTFAEWRPGEVVILKRFAGYWGGGSHGGTGFAGPRNPYAEEIHYVVMEDGTARLAALESGDIHWAYIYADDMATVEANPALQIMSTGPSLEFWNFWFNVKSGPFANKDMRLAFAYGTDTEEMLAATGDAQGSVTGSPIHPSSAFYSDVHAQRFTRDVEKAKQHLAAAGYKGETITIISCKCYSAMEKEAVVAQSQLAEIGMNVQVEFMEWNALYEKAQKGDFTVLAYGYGAFTDPDYFYFGRMGPSNIFNGWSDPAFNDAVAQARLAPTLAERKALYEQAQQRVIDEVPTLFTFQPAYYFGVSQKLRDWQPSPTAFSHFWNAYLSE